MKFGIILVAAYLCPDFLLAQQFELAAPLISQEREGDPAIWTEDLSARTVYTSTWHSDDGRIKIRNSSRPIHFEQQAGILIPIDPSMKKSGPGTWSATQQPFPTYLEKDGSYRISTGEGSTLQFGGNLRVQNNTWSGAFTVDNNTVSFPEVNGVSRDILFRENGAKAIYTILTPTAVQSDMRFSEQLELPPGYSLVPEDGSGKMESYGWTGNLLVKNKTGRVVATVYAPLCFDQNNAAVLGGYTIERKGNSIDLSLTVPASWLLQNERTYPVIVDPLVIGPTAAWTGGTMPSCFTPSYNVDSILVTIPGGITVTELNVTASFYADPFTPAIMANGRMFFSTSCANSQVFSITGNPGLSAGTAYLDSFDLHNPLTCCYAESCNDQTFYLRYHLQRVALGSGCNTTYIRYDPITTSWPFEAVVIGRTPESYAAQWSVPSAAICSNQCSITGTAYVYYGVPPYTFTHPWTNDVYIDGVNNGCATGATNQQIQLTIPNCPSFCDENFTSLNVPPPTITDACGNVVSGLPTKIVPIKTAPQVVATYDADICSGTAFDANLDPCVAGANVVWSGNGSNGTGDLSDTLIVSQSGLTDTVSYLASAELNGCFSDTTALSVIVHPLPNVAFNYVPATIVSSVQADFSDATNFNASSGVWWQWTMGDGVNYLDQNHPHTYNAPGSYTVCLSVVDAESCSDSLCQDITVVPAEVERPNVITANNDGVNDFLAFRYLEFYPDNELFVYNRWGNEVYYAKNYQNNWNGGSVNEGTYFFRLVVRETGDDFQGYFQIVR